MGYTFGFIFSIAAGQQLFTENTGTPVIPVLRQPSIGNIARLLRRWGTVLAGNIIGGAIAAAVFVWMLLFSPETDEAFLSISRDLMEKTPIQMLAAGGIVSGWLIATMVWTIHELETSKLSLVFLATYLGGIGDFPHVVVGSIKVACLLFMAEARAPKRCSHS